MPDAVSSPIDTDPVMFAVERREDGVALITMNRPDRNALAESRPDPLRWHTGSKRPRGSSRLGVDALRTGGVIESLGAAGYRLNLDLRPEGKGAGLESETCRRGR